MNNQEDNERPIWVNLPQMFELAREASDPRTVGVVIALLAYGNNQAFAWSPEKVAEFLNERAPDNISVEDLENMRDSLLLFFTDVGGGRWAPSPDVFSVVDANPGGLS